MNLAERLLRTLDTRELLLLWEATDSELAGVELRRRMTRVVAVGPVPKRLEDVQ